MILVLALSPSLDVTYELPALSRNTVNRIRTVTRVPGGKALNAARVAAALGADVQVVVPLGGSSGSWISGALFTEGISPTVVPVDAETRTCVAVVEDDGAVSSTDLYEASTPLDGDAWRALATAVADTVASRKPAWLLVSGSLPPGVPPSAVAELLGEARAAGVRTVVDSSGEGLRALVPVADLVKVNRAEAAELLDRDGTPQEAARALADRWACDAVVTDGVRPGAAVIGGNVLPVRAPSRAGRFPAGSGDAFLGALVVALLAGGDATAALDAAASAAEANARVPGAGVLDSLPTG